MRLFRFFGRFRRKLLLRLAEKMMESLRKMTESIKQEQLREFIRLLDRKLGVLNDREMACCGVTLAQCHALVEIGRVRKISLIDLANLLNLDNSTTSRTVNNLVNRGFVSRELDPGDRRYISISLTKSGLQIFGEIEKTMEGQFRLIYSRIPENKRDQVVESLRILLEAVD